MEIIEQIKPIYGKAEISSVIEYLSSGGWLTEHHQTAKLESRIGELLRTSSVSMVNNGTISLSIALLALGLVPGDEVLVPNLTMIATPNSCRLIGVNPVLVDVSPVDLCFDVEVASKLISRRTKAVIYVSLNGRASSINKVVEFCREHDLELIEDAAQSFGSQYNDKFIGTFGSIGSFSFSPHKIITTGQGGCLVTDSEKLSQAIKRLKDFGRLIGGHDIHENYGINSKFTDFQASFGLAQLDSIQERITKKKEIYSSYMKYLVNNPNITMIQTDLSQTVPWFVDIYVNQPDMLQKHLLDNKIKTRRIYPPISSQVIYKESKKFPNSEFYSSRGLWLPSSIDLTESDIVFISNKINNFI